MKFIAILTILLPLLGAFEGVSAKRHICACDVFCKGNSNVADKRIRQMRCTTCKARELIFNGGERCVDK